LTPGAWEKQGLTYKLTKDTGASPSSPSDTSSDMVRFLKLDRLRNALWKYAAAHEGKFPPDQTVSEIPQEAWQTADLPVMRYIYVPNQIADKGATPLVFEPELDRPLRLVLLTNGEIRPMSSASLTQALGGETK
jgi:hypothetical protein